MAIGTEHGGVLKLDSTSGGSLVDYSSWVGNVTPPDNQNTTSTYFVINDLQGRTSQGASNSSFSVEVYRDGAAGSLHRMLEAWSPAGGGTGGLRSFQLDTPDSTAGSERYAGECRLMSYVPGRIVAGSSEPPRGTATFQVDDGYTASTI